MGLFVATPSYNGRIAFSIICERQIMPDIAFFRECIDDSFAELMAAKPKPQKAPAKPKAATAKPKAAPKAAAKPKPKAKPATKARAKPVAKGNATGKNRKK
jgi:outer membrane biosynthesis protein TonB